MRSMSTRDQSDGSSKRSAILQTPLLGFDPWGDPFRQCVSSNSSARRLAASYEPFKVPSPAVARFLPSVKFNAPAWA